MLTGLWQNEFICFGDLRAFEMNCCVKLVKVDVKTLEKEDSVLRKTLNCKRVYTVFDLTAKSYIK